MLKPSSVQLQPMPPAVAPGMSATRAALGPVPGCSIGIMAYNEEANIAAVLHSVLGQTPIAADLAEVIVVASGCEDRTVEIVTDIASRDDRVRLVQQRRREGKASAINLFIAMARAPVLLMVSADVVVEDGTLDALLRHFDDPEVGMVGGHPIPVNGDRSFLGHAVHLQWRLHDRIARQTPKLGEIVAFRNVVPSIPLDSAVDEISIQALITQLGYRLVYEPEAIVYNRGPATVRDFLCQRRRIYAGHLRIRDQQAYRASTMSGRVVARAMSGTNAFTTPRAAMWSLGTVGLEMAARALGQYDVIRGRSQHIWEISGTTKRQIADGARGQGQHAIVVFQIANFHRHQLDLGAHAGRQLTRRVAEHVKRVLGADATVSVHKDGTIVALVSGDREAADRAAQDVVRRVAATRSRAGARDATVAVKLACGVIALPQASSPPHQPLSIAAVEPNPAPAVAS